MRDIEECFVYIAQENLDIGIIFLLAVEDTLEQLTAFPHVGRMLEFRNNRVGNVRLWHVKGYEKYGIFYTVEKNIIEVIRVLHGSRHIKSLLGPAG